jgi:hypothetical protein
LRSFAVFPFSPWGLPTRLMIFTIKSLYYHGFRILLVYRLVLYWYTLIFQAADTLLSDNDCRVREY